MATAVASTDSGLRYHYDRECAEWVVKSITASLRTMADLTAAKPPTATRWAVSAGSLCGRSARVDGRLRKWVVSGSAVAHRTGAVGLSRYRAPPIIPRKGCRRWSREWSMRSSMGPGLGWRKWWWYAPARWNQGGVHLCWHLCDGRDGNEERAGGLCASRECARKTVDEERIELSWSAEDEAAYRTALRWFSHAYVF